MDLVLVENMAIANNNWRKYLMKISITAQSNTLDAQCDQRFGRCQYFIIIDTDTMDYETIHNAGGAVGGAGIQAAQLMVDNSVKTVLTGNLGPNAFRTLSAAGIQGITGVSGTVKEIIEKYKKGEFSKPADGPSVDSHAGM